MHGGAMEAGALWGCHRGEAVGIYAGGGGGGGEEEEKEVGASFEI